MTLNDLVAVVPESYMVGVFTADETKHTAENAVAWFAAGTYASLSTETLNYTVNTVEVQARQNSIFMSVIIPPVTPPDASTPGGNAS